MIVAVLRVLHGFLVVFNVRLRALLIIYGRGFDVWFIDLRF